MLENNRPRIAVNYHFISVGTVGHREKELHKQPGGVEMASSKPKALSTALPNPPSSSLEAFLAGMNLPETNRHLTLKNSWEKRAFTHFNETFKKREENQLFSS